MTDAELMAAVGELKSTMVLVATRGHKGPDIADLNPRFTDACAIVSAELKRRVIPNALPFNDLWAWRGRWSDGSLPRHDDRRAFVSEVFEPLLRAIKSGPPSHFEPTGWERVDRTIPELRSRLQAATVTEQYQTIGLLCREALITLGQVVYQPERHLAPGEEVPGLDHAAKRLDAFVAVELSGSFNKHARASVKAAYDFALHLQHKRTATYRLAALCAEATTAVISMVVIASGRRDPS